MIDTGVKFVTETKIGMEIKIGIESKVSRIMPNGMKKNTIYCGSIYYLFEFN